MEQNTVDKFLENVGFSSRVKVRVTRFGGMEEYHETKNIATATGLNHLAGLAIGAAANSAFAYLAVGTVTGAASLGSTEFGEVSRKTPVTVASSKETFFMVCTWGGAADSVTSLDLQSAAMGNHASSGQGELFNIINGVNVTLADSDFLNLEVQVRVGSHNL